VTLVRVASRALDDDNLSYSFKAIRDAVAAWIGADDRPGSGITWRYDQCKGQAKYQAARIIVEGRVWAAESGSKVRQCAITKAGANAALAAIAGAP
jgi:hypothetical protein